MDKEVGPNIRVEGGIPVCNWCGFALIVEGPRQCCDKGREYDKDSTYRLPDSADEGRK